MVKQIGNDESMLVPSRKSKTAHELGSHNHSTRTLTVLFSNANKTLKLSYKLFPLVEVVITKKILTVKLTKIDLYVFFDYLNSV